MIAFGLVPKTGSPPVRLRGPDLLIASALAIITFVLFAHAAHNGFMYIDDWGYVTENPQVQKGLTVDSLRWALTTFHASNWHPLTWISHELDCQLFGGIPVEPHLENAAIHAGNCSLLFTVLMLVTGRRWPSAFCAAFFGWHPLRVESVAWIAERKDVLSVGNLLADQGDLEDAETHLRKSLSYLPCDQTEEALARIMRQKAERLPGEVEYAREARENPSDSLVHYKWASLLLRNERIRGAVFQYRLYLDAHPNDAMAHDQLGIAFTNGSYLSDAQREFETAIALDPDCADAYCGLGIVLARKGRLSEAATNFHRSLKIDSAMHAARIGLELCR